MKIFVPLFRFFFLSCAVIVFSSKLGAVEPVRFSMTPDKPLAEMRDEVRAWRAADSSRAETPVEVLAAPGTWTIAAPVEFDARDSFTHYKAEKAGTAILTRGGKITGIALDKDGRFTAKIDVHTPNGRFDTLFVNGKRATLAQEPDEFYYYIEKAVPVVAGADGSEVNTEGRAFVSRQEELPVFKNLAKAANGGPISDVYVKFFHSWETSLHRIESFDENKSRVFLTARSPWGLDSWGPNLRYTVANFAEALDMPDEWFLSTEGTLTYIPLPGQTPENTELFASAGVAPAESGLLRIAGDMEKINAAAQTPNAPEASLFVRNLTFDGFVFTGDEYLLPAEGLVSSQAATSSPVSVTVAGAKRVAFSNCEMTCLGGYAVHIGAACSECGVENSLIENLGAGGVKIGGNPAALDCFVRNNVIRDYGQRDGGAVGVWMAGAQNSEITHNDISDGFYTGVSIGWVWGYAPSPTHHNTVAFNRIHNIGHGVLSDMGGVYSLGISPGTVVANNVIHDVWSYNRTGRGGWGLYTDEGSSEITIENNLVYRVHTGTFHQHYGRENIVRNNILAFSLDGQIQRSRIEDHRSFFFENNIVVWDKPPLLASNWKDGHFVMKNNLYWYCGSKELDAEREEKFFAGQTLDQWQAAGHDEGSLIADPEFTDAAHNDFTFKNGLVNDAVKKIGFVPFDFSLAGVEGERMKTIAANYEYKQVVFAPDGPEPPPFALNETFEEPRKSPTPDAYLSTENIDAAASVLFEDGNKFLRLTDADSFKAQFNPHFYYGPNYKEGTVWAAFDVRLSADMILNAEGRTLDSTHYKTGPILRFAPGKMTLGPVSAEIAPEVWYRVSLVFPIGKSPAQGGTVKIVRLSDGATVLAETPFSPASEEFRSLDWFGFYTPGKSGTADLDNITLRVE